MQRIRNASAKKSTKHNKRHTPEGANLSVSETSLLDIEPSVDHNTNTLKTDNNEPSTSHSSTIQPQTRIALRNEIQPAREEEAVEGKSESIALLKTFDTTSPIVDAEPPPMKSTPPPPQQPHSTSEVSITKVSVAPVVGDLKAHRQTNKGNTKGALQTVITTTSHLHQTRQRHVKTKPCPLNVPDESNVNRLANEHVSVLVQGISGKDEDHSSRSSVCPSEAISSTKSQESAKKIHFQLDPKVYINIKRLVHFLVHIAF